MEQSQTALTVYNRSGEAVSKLDLSPKWLDFEPRPHLVHDYVLAYNTNQRQWSASTKNRSEVAATGKKPWRQKGTGRARAGTLASPLFRGGGVTFGPRPKNVRVRLPKKVKQLAFKTVLHQRISSNNIVIVDEIKLEHPRTKDITEMLKKLNIPGKLLVVLDSDNPNVVLSMRNIPNLTLRRADDLNTYDLIAHPKLLCTTASAGKLGILEDSVKEQES